MAAEATAQPSAPKVVEPPASRLWPQRRSACAKCGTSFRTVVGKYNPPSGASGVAVAVHASAKRHAVEAPAARTATRRTATMVRKARTRLKKREIGPEPNHFCAALNPARPRTTGSGRSGRLEDAWFEEPAAK